MSDTMMKKAPPARLEGQTALGPKRAMVTSTHLDGEKPFGNLSRRDEVQDLKEGLLRLADSLDDYVDGLLAIRAEAENWAFILDNHGPAPSPTTAAKFRELAVDGFKILVAPNLKAVADGAGEVRA